MWRLLCSVLERVWASCRFSVSEEPLRLPCQWEAVLVVGLAGHTPASWWAAWKGVFVPGGGSSHSSGKWFNSFFFCFPLGVSGQPWSASYIWYPGPWKGAGPGTNHWSPSQPPPSTESRADFRVHFLLFRRWQVIIGVLCEEQDVAALGLSCLILLGFRAIRRRKNKRKWAKQNRTACWRTAWCDTVGGILNPTVAASVWAWTSYIISEPQLPDQ